MSGHEYAEPASRAMLTTFDWGLFRQISSPRVLVTRFFAEALPLAKLPPVVVVFSSATASTTSPLTLENQLSDIMP